jgi:hypothetical protein
VAAKLSLNYMQRLQLTFALVPLFGVMLYFLFAAPSGKEITPVVSQEISKASKKSLTLNRDAQRSKELQERKLLQDRQNIAMAKNAKAMTPERIKLMVDVLMQSREPRYRSLFENWNLDSVASEEVLKIIRGRETRINEILKTLNETGNAGRRDFVDNYKIEKTLAEIQLSNLLGESRYAEFAKLESQMDTNMQAQAQKIINKQLND